MKKARRIRRTNRITVLVLLLIIAAIAVSSLWRDRTGQGAAGQPEKEKTRQFIKRLKTLSFEIDGPEADFAEILQRIERFGRETMVSAGQLRRIALVFEELVIRNILPHVKSAGDGTPVSAKIEHSGEDGTAVITVRYAGDAFDPLTQGDEISGAIIGHMAESVSYSDEAGNRVEAVIGS